jgi:hypothetical protein
MKATTVKIKEVSILPVVILYTNLHNLDNYFYDKMCVRLFESYINIIAI